MIERCLETGDRGGLFTVVYRAVADRVREGIREGRFDDCERLERFDVIFARRYLDAARAWDEGARVRGRGLSPSRPTPGRIQSPSSRCCWGSTLTSTSIWASLRWIRPDPM